MNQRLIDRARAWRVVVDDTFETSTSLIAYGRRDGDSVVLKLVKTGLDEWRSGEAANAFGGRGMVRVLAFGDGAVLLERLQPGYSLVEWSVHDRDDDATAVLADVIRALSPSLAVDGCPTVLDWATAFTKYAASGDGRLPADIVSDAERVFRGLANSQTGVRLLHGDLQHSNVLFDDRRGWVSIDPKGVVGETEFEIAAALRNPCDRPDIFAESVVIERRLRRFVATLGVDEDRTLAWAFAQAVLSAIWAIEDGLPGNVVPPVLRLAEVIRPLLASVATSGSRRPGGPRRRGTP